MRVTRVIRVRELSARISRVVDIMIQDEGNSCPSLQAGVDRTYKIEGIYERCDQEVNIRTVERRTMAVKSRRGEARDEAVALAIPIRFESYTYTYISVCVGAYRVSESPADFS